MARATLDRHRKISEHVRAVVLFDALYGGAERYAHWLHKHAPADARMVSLYLGSGSTRRESRKLRARARDRVVIAAARAAHRLVPERHLAETLRALRFLPRRTPQ